MNMQRLCVMMSGLIVPWIGIGLPVCMATPPKPNQGEARPASQPLPPSPKDTRSPANKGGHRWGSSRDFPFIREGFTSSPLVAYQQFMQEELSHVPSLQPMMLRLTELQQQRMNLWKERGKIAENREAPAGDSLKQFHALLSREGDINTKQKQVLDDMARDVDAIRKEIQARRQEVRNRLEELETTGPESAKVETDDKHRNTAEEQEIRSLNRKLRFYSYMDERMEDLKTGANRESLVNRFFKGLPLGDPSADNRMNDQLKKRVGSIQQQQDRLMRQMEDLNSELDLVRGLLEESDKQPGSQDGRRDNRRWDRRTTTTGTKQMGTN
jgi:hypothetical protein